MEKNDRTSWQKLCIRMTEKFKTEAELEGVLSACLDLIFDWDSNHTDRQSTIKFGHANKRPDFF